MKTRNILSLALRIVASIIMAQSLYFKFSAHPESVYIFSAIGIEPWGRIGTGVAELIAVILLLVPTTISIGALMGAGIMLGAIGSHLLFLGIEVQGDHGQLFIYALLVFIACGILLGMYYREGLQLLTRIIKK
jgi:putative oxidoreductase